MNDENEKIKWNQNQQPDQQTGLPMDETNPVKKRTNPYGPRSTNPANKKVVSNQAQIQPAIPKEPDHPVQGGYSAVVEPPPHTQDLGVPIGEPPVPDQGWNFSDPSSQIRPNMNQTGNIVPDQEPSSDNFDLNKLDEINKLVEADFENNLTASEAGWVPPIQENSIPVEQNPTQDKQPGWGQPHKVEPVQDQLNQFGLAQDQQNPETGSNIDSQFGWDQPNQTETASTQSGWVQPDQLEPMQNQHNRVQNSETDSGIDPQFDWAQPNQTQASPTQPDDHSRQNSFTGGSVPTEPQMENLNQPRNSIYEPRHAAEADMGILETGHFSNFQDSGWEPGSPTFQQQDNPGYLPVNSQQPTPNQLQNYQNDSFSNDTNLSQPGYVPETVNNQYQDNQAGFQRQQVTRPVKDRKSLGVPKYAIIAGIIFAMLVGLGAILYILFSGEDEKTAETTVPTLEQVTTPVTAAVVLAPEVSLEVIPTICLADPCGVSGPVDSNALAPYNIVVNFPEGLTPTEYEVKIDGVVLEDPKSAFGFEGSPGRHVVEVSFVDGSETVIFNQYAFSNQLGFGVVLDTINRQDPGFESALDSYDNLVGTYPELILTEGAYFSGFSRDEYILYVGGFIDEAEAQSFCTNSGLDNVACKIQNFIEATG